MRRTHPPSFMAQHGEALLILAFLGIGYFVFDKLIEEVEKRKKTGENLQVSSSSSAAKQTSLRSEMARKFDEELRPSFMATLLPVGYFLYDKLIDKLIKEMKKRKEMEENFQSTSDPKGENENLTKNIRSKEAEEFDQQLSKLELLRLKMFPIDDIENSSATCKLLREGKTAFQQSVVQRKELDNQPPSVPSDCLTTTDSFNYAKRHSVMHIPDISHLSHNLPSSTSCEKRNEIETEKRLTKIMVTLQEQIRSCFDSQISLKNETKDLEFELEDKDADACRSSGLITNDYRQKMRKIALRSENHANNCSDSLRTPGSTENKEVDEFAQHLKQIISKCDTESSNITEDKTSEKLMKAQQEAARNQEKLSRMKENMRREQEEYENANRQRQIQFEEELREQQAKHQEKIEGMRRERERIEREADLEFEEQLKRIEEQKQAFWKCVQMKLRFEEKEQEWADFIQTLRDTLIRPIKQCSRLKDAVESVFNENDDNLDKLSIKKEYDKLYLTTLEAYRVFHDVFFFLENVSEQSPDRIFLRILMKSASTMSDKLFGVLERLDQVDDSDIVTIDYFKDIHLSDVPSTWKLKEVSKTARMEDYLHIDSPKLYEQRFYIDMSLAEKQNAIKTKYQEQLEKLKIEGDSASEERIQKHKQNKRFTNERSLKWIIEEDANIDMKNAREKSEAAIQNIAKEMELEKAKHNIEKQQILSEQVQKKTDVEKELNEVLEENLKKMNLQLDKELEEATIKRQKAQTSLTERKNEVEAESKSRIDEETSKQRDIAKQQETDRQEKEHRILKLKNESEKMLEEKLDNDIIKREEQILQPKDGVLKAMLADLFKILVIRAKQNGVRSVNQDIVKIRHCAERIINFSAKCRTCNISRDCELKRLCKTLEGFSYNVQQMSESVNNFFRLLSHVDCDQEVTNLEKHTRSIQKPLYNLQMCAASAIANVQTPETGILQKNMKTLQELMNSFVDWKMQIKNVDGWRDQMRLLLNISEPNSIETSGNGTVNSNSSRQTADNTNCIIS